VLEHGHVAKVRSDSYDTTYGDNRRGNLLMNTC
jgi:hypothetical protein